jgi:2-methylcitrate dehydratase PrpD
LSAVANPSSNIRESLSGVIAAYASSLDGAEVDDAVLHALRRAMVDYLACVYAGNDQPATQSIRRWATAEGGAPAATVVGSQVRLPASQAAFVNGAAAHSLDFDDGYTRGSVHPGGVIYSAALASAEKYGASATDFIAGVVAGYDMMLRLAEAMHPASALRGWHNTAVAGVLGAAVTAGRIKGLSPLQLRDAIGLATSFSGGIREYLNDGAEVKRLHPGKSARDGIVCAELAAEGISGSIRSLEGADGLFRAMVDDKAKAGRLEEGLGTEFLITQAYFKPYPCCRHFHAAIDATLALRDEGVDPSRVRGITIGLYEVGAHGHDHCTASNLLEVQMSAPCAVVTSLLHGFPSVSTFDPAIFTDPEAQRLLSATTLEVDDECQAIYPKVRSGVVTLELDDGKRVQKRVLEPRGEVANPLSDQDLSQKFMNNLPKHISREKAARLLDWTWNMKRDSDLSAMFPLLAGN